MSVSSSSLLTHRKMSPLEHGLRQKLILMENAVARIAHTKTQLKQNAEQVRKEIASTISHQLAIIRSREQELLSHLDSIQSLKEQLLSEHQEQLHQAIGACQHGLQCVLRNGEKDALDVREMLLRLNAMDLRVRENAHIAFEADTLEMRHAVAEFGTLISDHRFPANESLPMEMEEYDEDDALQHKSVVRVGGPVLGGSHARLPPTRSERIMRKAVTGTAHGDSVGTWLRNMKSNCEVEPNLFEDFDIIRDRSVSFTNSSIEIVPSPVHSDPASLFQGHFTAVRNSPMSKWLHATDETKKDNGDEGKIPVLSADFLDTTSTSETTDFGRFIRLADAMDTLKVQEKKEHEEMPANAKKRRVQRRLEQGSSSVETTPQNEECLYVFPSVIAGVLESDNEQWLMSAKKNASSLQDPVVKKETVGNFNEEIQKQKSVWLPAMVDNRWLVENADSTTKDRVCNSSAQNVATWESILGWQAILERIHASGDDDWLAPSSRHTP